MYYNLSIFTLDQFTLKNKLSPLKYFLFRIDTIFHYRDILVEREI